MQEQFEVLTGAAKPEPEIEPMIEHFKHMPAKERQLALAKIMPQAGDGAQNNEGDAMLTWDEVLAMHRGGIEFESHTVTHPLLVYEDDQSVQFELLDCKQALEEKLNQKVRALAYPNGTWDARVRNAAEKAGYICAFTTERGLHREGGDPYAIPRIMLHEGNVTGMRGKFSPAILSLRLSGWR
jgi:peptidoglycan/xylan/chitin deacetylase (PgdA/CDA1 family)